MPAVRRTRLVSSVIMEPRRVVKPLHKKQVNSLLMSTLPESAMASQIAATCKRENRRGVLRTDYWSCGGYNECGMG